MAMESVAPRPGKILRVSTSDVANEYAWSAPGTLEADCADVTEDSGTDKAVVTLCASLPDNVGLTLAGQGTGGSEARRKAHGVTEKEACGARCRSTRTCGAKHSGWAWLPVRSLGG